MNIDWAKVKTKGQVREEALISLQTQFIVAIQVHMDIIAQRHKYDNIHTAVTYAEEPSVAKFQKEGKAFRAWRSKVWDYAYKQLALVENGARTQPTVEDFIEELPVLEVPK